MHDCDTGGAGHDHHESMTMALLNLISLASLIYITSPFKFVYRRFCRDVIGHLNTLELAFESHSLVFLQTEVILHIAWVGFPWLRPINLVMQCGSSSAYCVQSKVRHLGAPFVPCTLESFYASL